MLINMYLFTRIQREKASGVRRTKLCMSMAGYNSEDSEVHIRYARGRRGTALSCLTGCDRSLFLFGLLTSYPSVIVQGYSPRHPKEKGWWGTRWDTQGKATAVIPDNAARDSLLTWTAVEIYSPAGA